MNPINFAILGPHNRGGISLRAHRPEEGLNLIALCASHLEGLDRYKERCGPDLIMTTDYREIMANPKVDAVFVCTPDYLHAEHAVAALEAGKHVFCEKPMAITIEDCDRIIAAAKKSTGKLFVGHNMRYFPVMQKMRELIEQGCIGRVEAIWCRHFINYGGDAYFKDWHSERALSTGLLLQKGAHDIDIIHWLGGSYSRRVAAMGKLSVYNQLPRRDAGDPVPPVTFDINNWPPEKTSGYSPVIDVEDHNMVLMELENGVQASYQQCHYTPDDQRNYTIIGTRGRIENFGDHSTPEHAATVHVWNRRTGYSEHGHEVFRIPHLEGTHGGSDPLLVEDFLRLLRDQPTVGATPLDARMAVATGCVATQAVREVEG